MTGARFSSFYRTPSPLSCYHHRACLRASWRLSWIAPVQYVRVIARNGHLADASGRLRMYFGTRLDVQRCLEREFSPSTKANPS